MLFSQFVKSSKLSITFFFSIYDAICQIIGSVWDCKFPMTRSRGSRGTRKVWNTYKINIIEIAPSHLFVILVWLLYPNLSTSVNSNFFLWVAHKTSQKRLSSSTNILFVFDSAAKPKNIWSHQHGHFFLHQGYSFQGANALQKSTVIDFYWAGQFYCPNHLEKG